MGAMGVSMGFRMLCSLLSIAERLLCGYDVHDGYEHTVAQEDHVLAIHLVVGDSLQHIVVCSLLHVVLAVAACGAEVIDC